MPFIVPIADEKWEEVRFINGYAIYVGYLSLGVRGLSILVVSWTTIVLLGGFVSVLERTDFWCLTVMIIAQTPGVFDLFAIENIRTSLLVWSGSVSAEVRATTMKMIRRSEGMRCTFPRVILIGTIGLGFSVLSVIQAPLLLLYVLGLYISSGISLWRLIQHNYGGDGDASKANLNPALYLLYYLVLLQGLLLCYRDAVVRIVGPMVTRRVATEYGLGVGDAHAPARRLLEIYAQETRERCASTGPSFARGRNLFTYAVELLESKPSGNYCCGVWLLDGLLRRQQERKSSSTDGDGPRRREILLEQHKLVKHLLLGGPADMTIQRLLHTLGCRSPYDREIRGSAARIVAHLAGGIRLERFPGGIQCVSSLLGTAQEYLSMEPFQRDWLLEAYEPDCLDEAYDQVCFNNALYLKEPRYIFPEPILCIIRKTTRSGVQVDDDKDIEAYRDLVLQGMRILRKLAANEDNCKTISNTPGLLSKIMAPLTSDLLHNSDHVHAEWPSDVVEGSLRVMLQLAAASGEAGTNLRSTISGHRQAIATMLDILRCHECQAKEYCLPAFKVLTHLCLDDESCQPGTESTEEFIKILLNKFVDDDQDRQSSIRKLVGEALAMLSGQSECNTAIILNAIDTVLDDLIEILLHGQNTTHRKNAAQILENLCRQYNGDDECLRKLKVKAMTDATQKVLKEILLPRNLAREEPPISGSSNLHSDLESQHTRVAKDKGQKKISFPHTNFEQHKDTNLQVALLSLSVTVCDTFFSADQSLVYAIAPEGHDASSFAKMLVDMVKRIGELMDHHLETQQLRKLVSRKTNSEDDRLRILELREIIQIKKDSRNDYLEILKLTSKMVISMMKHRDSYEQQDLQSLITTLSTASEKLLTPDCSMVFSGGGHHGAMPRNPIRTLGSLVKEAHELLDKIKGPELAVVSASSAEGNLV